MGNVLISSLAGSGPASEGCSGHEFCQKVEVAVKKNMERPHTDLLSRQLPTHKKGNETVIAIGGA
jgi:hypothetical protein